VGYDDADRKLSDVMSDAWARFAATGDPNGPGLPKWPLYKASSYKVLDFGDTVELGSNANDANMEFLENAYRKMRKIAASN